MDEIIELEEIEAPWAKVIKVQEHTYEGGFKMIRLRIHEGRRITDLELDSATAAHLSETLGSWARANQPDGGNNTATQPDGGNNTATQPDGGNNTATQPDGGNNTSNQPDGGQDNNNNKPDAE